MDTLTLQAGPTAVTPVVLPGPADAPLLVARQISFPAGHHIAPHRHIRGQFLFAAAGTMFVRTPGHAWMVPPSRALWIPADTEHAIDAHGALHMRTLYLNAASAALLPQTCAVLDVTALLRELIIRMTSPPDDRTDAHAVDLIARLAISEMSRLPSCALELPLPVSADLLAMCEAILLQPAGGGIEPDTGSEPPATPPGSARTLYRRFLAETGLSFVQWQKQANLLHAVRMLSTGLSVTHVALELGYESPSAFTAMFRRKLGVPPRMFLAEPVKP